MRRGAGNMAHLSGGGSMVYGEMQRKTGKFLPTHRVEYNFRIKCALPYKKKVYTKEALHHGVEQDAAPNTFNSQENSYLNRIFKGNSPYRRLQIAWHRILRLFLKTFNLVSGVP